MRKIEKRILVGCEESQAVCKAFRKLGFEAYSCDLKPCSGGHPEWHIQGDVLDVINDGWDMGIFFPDCTYLTVSGLHWNERVEGRSEKTAEALEFVRTLMKAPIKRKALENPVGAISSEIRKPDQIIQPYNFGEDASKATCLWLWNLPPLYGTSYYPPRITADGEKRWSNQTDSGQNNLPPSDDRAELRSKTYPGVADAMADQWGKVLTADLDFTTDLFAGLDQVKPDDKRLAA